MKIFKKIFLGLVAVLILISFLVGTFSGNKEKGVTFYIQNFQKYLTPLFMKVVVEPRQKRLEKVTTIMMDSVKEIMESKN